MKLLTAYLKMHHKSLLLILSASLIFCAVFALYDLPLAAVGYASLLSLCVAAVWAGIDFLLFFRKHKLLLGLTKEIQFGLDGLPPAQTLMEQDYQQLLSALYQYTAQLATDCDRSQTEMMDYCTMWAHQIKTPIAAMHILLQAEDSENCAALQDSLFKIEEYVQMVLSYSRLNSDTTDFVLKHYDLDNIVRQAIHKYAPLFIRRKIHLHFTPTGFSALTDEKWLSFVIEQILSNSMKYTHAGGSVDIYLENGTTLVIADTGIGIAPEDLPRIGQKGFTGYNGRTDKKSTGLGLYLCRRTLDRLSHTFSITSAVGQGTKVKIGLNSRNIRFE